ncbi:hypothetical protein SsS58_08005 [Streptomyces scabiei]|uniref:Uncharacterized protein n=2 Tax=Streptomyces scabiei TaxID=1930 RepID=A0A100JXK8_STRSC|nr:hypothetical protein SsS58_08005 [Streptomyces scabiei]
MMPPMCAVCPPDPLGTAPFGTFTLVHFRATRAAPAYEEGRVGHPENAVWFCAAHAPLAERLKECTAAEALEHLA